MSLGQRLQQNPIDKSSELVHGDNEATIQKLKLLSKAQSALLKAYLHSKLSLGESVVQKTLDYLASANNNNDPKLLELKNLLLTLKLKDIEVDVNSTQVQLFGEISALRTSLQGLNVSDNNVDGINDKNLIEIKALEVNNKLLQEKLKNSELQIKSLQEQLEIANNNNMKASTSIPSINNDSEIKSLQSEINLLKTQLNNKSKDITEKDAIIAAHLVTINNHNNDKEKHSKDKNLKENDLENSLKERKNLEDKLKTTIEEYEGKLHAKGALLNKENDEKIKQIESKLEAEKDEMMEAMAQEIEEIEATKAAEINGLTKQLEQYKHISASFKKANLGLNAKLQSVVSTVKILSKDYKKIQKDSKKDLNELEHAIQTQYKVALVNKLKSVQAEISAANMKYRKEMIERKKLHNIIQELKGNIRVFLRCRPPTKKEIEQFGNDAQCVSFSGGNEIKVFNEKNREKTWEFDEVFDTYTKQEQVYEEVSALITSVMDGYNVCIFAYGQTGSGKTWTMSGPEDNRGVNTRALDELFNKKSSRASEWKDTITVSLLEVYNEDIRDLLSENRNSDEKLEVKIGPHGNYVPGLISLPVDNLAAVINLIATADRNRSSATTNMNEHSSRSHMILTANVVSQFLPTGVITRGKLNLVDLAGSERINKSGATGQALKEAQNINKSLSALGDVIAARAAKQAHVPFRNSTLTYLLQDSISQDSKTLMIVCISPVLYNSEETFCSLNFASRVRTVELGRAGKNIQAPAEYGATSNSKAIPNTSGSTGSGSGRQTIRK